MNKKHRRIFSKNTYWKLKKVIRCQRCLREKELQTHHIKPVSHGGTNNIKNLMRVCMECHNILDKEALQRFIYDEDYI